MHQQEIIHSTRSPALPLGARRSQWSLHGGCCQSAKRNKPIRSSSHRSKGRYNESQTSRLKPKIEWSNVVAGVAAVAFAAKTFPIVIGSFGPLADIPDEAVSLSETLPIMAYFATGSAGLAGLLQLGIPAEEKSHGLYAGLGALGAVVGACAANSEWFYVFVIYLTALNLTCVPSYGCFILVSLVLKTIANPNEPAEEKC